MSKRLPPLLGPPSRLGPSPLGQDAVSQRDAPRLLLPRRPLPDLHQGRPVLRRPPPPPPPPAAPLPLPLPLLLLLVVAVVLVGVVDPPAPGRPAHRGELGREGRRGFGRRRRRQAARRLVFAVAAARRAPVAVSVLNGCLIINSPWDENF